MGKIKFSYCDYCEKEVEPVKKKLDSMQITIWVIASICTLGFGIIGYLIYNVSFRKKHYCPNCESKLKFSETPFEKPKPLEELTTKERVLAKTGKKITVKEEPKEKLEEEMEEKEEEKIFCSFCGEELSEKVATCPYCKAVIKF